jgi:beta-lactamase regulating signal transducer with metallopeptidase domain
VSELAVSWWSWLAPATLQATPLLGAVWLVDRLGSRRLWPQLLTTLWLVALVRLVLPPTLASPWSVTTTVGAPTLAAAQRTADDARLAWLALAWSIGVLACLAARARRRSALAARIVELAPEAGADWRAALQQATSVLRLARAPRLGTLAGLATPAVSGLLRPILLLPGAALARPPARHDRHALLHELAHLRRRDLWLDEACELLRALFWFHPLVWAAAGRVRALGEMACDAAVARLLGGGARDYRDTLVRAAGDLFLPRQQAGVRAFLGRRAVLLARLEHLERLPRAPLAAMRAVCCALALVLFACVLPMAPASPAPAAWRASAQRVLAAQLRGERQSCFTLHAAALVLAADAPATSDPSGD